jgi:transglutaminase-like putative cysteine protease
MSYAWTPVRGVPARRKGRRAAASPPVTFDVVVLGLAVAIALLPLLPVYGARAATPAVLGGVVLGAGTAALAARRRWGAQVTVAVVVGVYLLAGAALAMPDAAVAGVLPGVAAVAGLLRGSITVWKEVLTLDPELGAAADVLVAPYLLGLAGSAAAVSIAARAPRRVGALAGLIPGAVLGISLLLCTELTVQPLAAGVALVFLLLPWAAWHRGDLEPRRVVAIGVVAVAVAGGGIAGGPALVEDQPRFVLRDEMVPPFDPRDHPSPLSAFREFVKDWRETELLTVRGLPEGARVRLATMDAFDGVVWNVAGSEQTEGSGTFRRVGETIDTAASGDAAHIEFEVHELPMVWLPTVGYTERFDFAGDSAQDLADQLRYNDATGTAVLTGGVPDDATWSVDTVVPAPPSDADLENASIGSVRLPEAQAVPEAVSVRAAEVAGTASSEALIARSLEEWLSERGWFSHGVEDQDYPSLSGHGADRIITLLTGPLMVGDGEQYASAMALMARVMGLPSRVVLGFVPDEDVAGDEEIVITGDDIQAWVEIQFAGNGWVTFDPTPDESRTPREDTEPEQAAEEPQVHQPPPPLQDPIDPPEEDTQQPQTQDSSEDEASARDWGQVIAVAASVGVPLLLLTVPLLLIALAKRRRRLRRRASGDTVTRVVGGWQEVIDEARDLHRPPPPTATRRETAVHLATAFVRRERSGTARRPTPPVGGTVAGLAASADAAVFGPGDPPEEQVDVYWQQVDFARKAMRSSVTRRQRLRSRWATASLRAARRSRRTVH